MTDHDLPINTLHDDIKVLRETVDGRLSGLSYRLLEIEKTLRGDTEEFDYVCEGWWNPDVKSGQVHDHNSNQPATMHRLCEPVYTRRERNP
jgi:hypothetical protein